jgi:DNA-binding response OmpR family regulator
MPALIVLVSADPRLLRMADAMLSDAGHLVAAVSSFHEAQNLLDSVTPDLLVSDLRLDPCSSLHLAIRSRLERPGLPVIVTHGWPDPVAEAEARHHGAEFVPAPLGHAEFLPLVQALIDRHRRAQPAVRRWSRKRAPGTVRVSAGDAPSRIIDVSYGGVRLAFDDERDVPPLFEITLPPSGTTIKAHCAWTARSARDHVWCGAEIDEAARPDWRHFIDSFAEPADEI